MTENPIRNEDPVLNARIRAAFEEDAGLGAARLRELAAAAEREVRRRHVARRVRRWGAAALLAASLVAVFCFRALTSAPASTCATDRLDAAIGLLCELDGIALDEQTKHSAGELLLAWQDAPCAELL